MEAQSAISSMLYLWMVTQETEAKASISLTLAAEVFAGMQTDDPLSPWVIDGAAIVDRLKYKRLK